MRRTQRQFILIFVLSITAILVYVFYSVHVSQKKTHPTMGVAKGAPKPYKLGFTALDKEQVIKRLKTSGTIPRWLSGNFICTGPAKLETPKMLITHWFDGFAMLHNFSFYNGNVSYANKFLQSHYYKHAKQTGKIFSNTFASDVYQPISSQFFSSIFGKAHGRYDNGNINVIKVADKYLALAETPYANRFDPSNLNTLGSLTFNAKLYGKFMCAHPHYDTATGDLFSYSVKLGQGSAYIIFRISPENLQVKNIAEIPTESLSYMHSFAITENYLILVEFPFTANPEKLLTNTGPFLKQFSFDANKKTSLTIIHKKNGEIIDRFDCKPFFALHHVNAYEKDKKIILDLAAYADTAILKSFTFDWLDKDYWQEAATKAHLRRCIIDLEKKEVETRSLSSEVIELPRINYNAFNTKLYSYVYGVGKQNKESVDFFDQLIKINVQTGNVDVWHQQHCYPTEPVFIPSPEKINGEQQIEDDGVILSIVLDGENKHSFLLILDAKTFKELGRASVPHHIPFTMHGNFFPSQ